MILVLLVWRCSPHADRGSILTLMSPPRSKVSGAPSLVLLSWAALSWIRSSYFAVPPPHFFLPVPRHAFHDRLKAIFSWKPSGSPTHWVECSYSVLPLTVHWVTAYTPCFVIAHLNSWICRWMDLVWEVSQHLLTTHSGARLPWENFSGMNGISVEIFLFLHFQQTNCLLKFILYWNTFVLKTLTPVYVWLSPFAWNSHSIVYCYTPIKNNNNKTLTPVSIFPIDIFLLCSFFLLCPL